MRLITGSLIAIFFLSCMPVERMGRVTKVVDGDTFDILNNNEVTRIRLFGIDAPERGQPFNRRARQFVDSLIAGKQLRVVVRDKDRYGRVVGDAYLPEGTHINAAIVEAGFAWQFTQFSTDAHIAALERTARERRRGLWQDTQPTPPWEFRKRKHSSTTR